MSCPALPGVFASVIFQAMFWGKRSLRALDVGKHWTLHEPRLAGGAPSAPAASRAFRGWASNEPPRISQEGSAIDRFFPWFTDPRIQNPTTLSYGAERELSTKQQMLNLASQILLQKRHVSIILCSFGSSSIQLFMMLRMFKSVSCTNKQIRSLATNETPVPMLACALSYQVLKWKVIKGVTSTSTSTKILHLFTDRRTSQPLQSPRKHHKKPSLTMPF